jgi:hypothetical protein
MTKAKRATSSTETPLDPAVLQDADTAPAAATDAPSADPAAHTPDVPAVAPTPRKSRAGTKQAAVIALLCRDSGATLAQLMEVTGWQIHTVRGALAGTLKRFGMNVTSDRAEGRRAVTASTAYRRTNRWSDPAARSLQSARLRQGVGPFLRS